MLSQIQRFGGAMFTPVLLFPFAGLVVGITILLQNPLFVGESLADSNGFFSQILYLLQEGAWTVFRNMPLLFCVGLPIGLAKTDQARACLASLVSFLTWNYFISAIGTLWGASYGVDFSQEVGGTSGLTMIAGIKTLDTNIIGAILIASVTTKVHNVYFEKELPPFLGIFQGTSLVVTVNFFVMVVLAWLTLLVWPKVQVGILQLQHVMVSSGAFGVWIYTFLERFLIPTGLHHFIYGPFIFGPAVTEHGIQVDWIQNMQAFSQSTESLKSLFPAGGFALHGNGKIFGSIGIALALYSTAKPENKVKLAGLLIPATLTAMLVGITEPLEFTFLFIAPLLFFVHSLLAATFAAVLFYFGVVGNMGGGLIDMTILNWAPMFHNHSAMIVTHFIISIIFIFIWFIVFRFLIVKLGLKTPGREDEKEEVKFYTKKDFKDKQETLVDTADGQTKEAGILAGLGGRTNIKTLNNCATRLRVEVEDPELVESDEYFKALGAHGVVRKNTAFQIIIGLSVSQLCGKIETLMKKG